MKFLGANYRLKRTPPRKFLSTITENSKVEYSIKELIEKNATENKEFLTLMRKEFREDQES